MNKLFYYYTFFSVVSSEGDIIILRFLRKAVHQLTNKNIEYTTWASEPVRLPWAHTKTTKCTAIMLSPCAFMSVDAIYVSPALICSDGECFNYCESFFWISAVTTNNHSIEFLLSTIEMSVLRFFFYLRASSTHNYSENVYAEFEFKTRLSQKHKWKAKFQFSIVYN